MENVYYEKINTKSWQARNQSMGNGFLIPGVQYLVIE